MDKDDAEIVRFFFIVSGKAPLWITACVRQYIWTDHARNGALHVSPEPEPSAGTQHVSVGLNERMNHTLRSVWETESAGIMTGEKSKRSDRKVVKRTMKEGEFNVTTLYTCETQV